MKKYLKTFAVSSIFILILFSACNNGQNNSGIGQLTLKNTSVVDTKISFVKADPEDPKKEGLNATVSIEKNGSQTWLLASGNYTISVSCTSSTISAFLPITIFSDETTTHSFVFDGKIPRIY